MREAEIKRETAETKVELTLMLEGSGTVDVCTGVGFLDHMLTLFARHGRFDLRVSCSGDTGVDDHHSTEDVAICLGKAFAKALGDCRGICRYGDCFLPMDEALVLTAADVSGRGMCVCELPLPAQKVGTFDTELVEDFLQAFAANAGITLHVRLITGRNTHHIIEAVFKGLGRVLRQAVKIDPSAAEQIPSTKGVLQ
ncbi:MAG: imidazoleglycerol-phosphate dehydratase HisB [Lachnospiraceae bacterium]|nr:imidazoleglycerol-phosphate dehydratase HisB [Lachnospiraceae bacterium]